MTTQALIRIDKKLKEKAQRKAKGLGITFSDLVQMTTRAFVEDKFTVGLIMEKEEKFNAKTARELTKILDDIEKGKNLIGPFKSAEEMMKSLES